MADAIEQECRELLMQAQVSVGRWLRGACNRGEMTEAQLEFILDLFANLDAYDAAEAMAQFAAWVEWVREGRSTA